jgi:hypothetical protein
LEDQSINDSLSIRSIQINKKIEDDKMNLNLNELKGIKIEVFDIKKIRKNIY